jgi:hypothetical protein
MSRDRAVGISTGYGLNNRGVEVRVPIGSSIFSSPRRPDRLCCPPSLYPMDTGDSFPGGKATSAQVNKTRVYTFTPPYAFMA